MTRDEIISRPQQAGGNMMSESTTEAKSLEQLVGEFEQAVKEAAYSDCSPLGDPGNYYKHMELDEARAALLSNRQVLEDKELCSAIVVAVMSAKQSERDAAVLKLQKHILAIEEERDDRESECERWAKANAELAANIAKQNSAVAVLREIANAQGDCPCPAHEFARDWLERHGEAP